MNKNVSFMLYYFSYGCKSLSITEGVPNSIPCGSSNVHGFVRASWDDIDELWECHNNDAGNFDVLNVLYPVKKLSIRFKLFTGGSATSNHFNNAKSEQLWLYFF